MSEKKIEPTDAMVTSAHSAAVGRLMTDPMTYRRILRAALNHPDAAGLFADVDGRPWEPLSEGDPLNFGDEVRQELRNLTITAVVARVGADGGLWAAEDEFIGRLNIGTWYVRRPVQELPTEDEAVIERADGHKYITAIFDGETYRAREAVLGRDGRWYGVWRRATPAPHVATSVAPEHITPDAWKVADQ